MLAVPKNLDSLAVFKGLQRALVHLSCRLNGCVANQRALAPCLVVDRHCFSSAVAATALDQPLGAEEACCKPVQSLSVKTILEWVGCACCLSDCFVLVVTEEGKTPFWSLPPIG